MFRAMLIVIVGLLLTIGYLRRKKVIFIVKEFFDTTTHPLNLAVFRIVVFLVLLGLLIANIPVWFSRTPATFLVPPPGLGWLLAWLPVNETWVGIASALFFVVCMTGLIGVFSRTSALLAFILGFYVLGVPHFYGKVSHYHHALWFVAILAASRCGDMLACDAIFSSWKRADLGDTAPPTSARIYALPLRFTWLLIGVVYFFPGFWKIWRGGFQWIYGDNLRFLFYSQWHDVPGYVPFFRIDQYPLLYRFGALGAVLFELTFIFLIFLPRIRPLVVVNGLVFHRMNAVFMRVTSFWSLEACYVAFFDWHTILHHIGRWLFREEMFVIYDGNCKICRRTIASLRRFDLFGRITYVNALDDKALSEHDLLWLDPQALATDMHAVVKRKTFVGFASYRALAARIPLMWPVLPLLYLPPIPAIGKRIYRRIADSRTCSIVRAPSPETEIVQHSSWLQRCAILLVGGFLLLVNVICGFGRVHSWPFACYPTFDGRARPQKTYLVMSVSTAHGERIEINPVREDASVGEAKRLPGTISSILGTRDESERQAKFEQFWQWMSESDRRLQDAAAVTFYVDTVSTIPERQDHNLIERKMVYERQDLRHREQSVR